jgi:alanine-glyoxylate transaminase / serine-glyoxylate transaminase / serine-pyruvate transaminase
VLQAMARATLGHLDPEYLAMMDEIRAQLQKVFRTRNETTFFLPGTGSAGMECAILNLIEPGDEVLCCVAGFFADRLRDLAERAGARVHVVEAKWGETISAEQVETALREHPEVRVVTLVHAETSTGAHQEIPSIARLAKQHNALLIVDAVTSLGGVPVEVDEWQIDACYSCSQKCLSAAPGLAPITFSAAALERIAGRKTRVPSFYLDVQLLRRYWGEERIYHHTAPANLAFGLLEALRLLEEEGLETRWQRHRDNHLILRQGLERLGLRYIPQQSLPQLNAVWVPEGIDELQIRRRLLTELNLEIGSGLGPFKGKAWRIGIMGASCTRRHVVTLLAALESVISDDSPG